VHRIAKDLLLLLTEKGDISIFAAWYTLISRTWMKRAFRALVWYITKDVDCSWYHPAALSVEGQWLATFCFQSSFQFFPRRINFSPFLSRFNRALQLLLDFPTPISNFDYGSI
jgi:hypothetical protein